MALFRSLRPLLPLDVGSGWLLSDGNGEDVVEGIKVGGGWVGVIVGDVTVQMSVAVGLYMSDVVASMRVVVLSVGSSSVVVNSSVVPN